MPELEHPAMHDLAETASVSVDITAKIVLIPPDIPMIQKVMMTFHCFMTGVHATTVR